MLSIKKKIQFSIYSVKLHHRSQSKTVSNNRFQAHTIVCHVIIASMWRVMSSLRRCDVSCHHCIDVTCHVIIASMWRVMSSLHRCDVSCHHCIDVTCHVIVASMWRGHHCIDVTCHAIVASMWLVLRMLLTPISYCRNRKSWVRSNVAGTLDARMCGKERWLGEWAPSSFLPNY